MGGHQLYWEEKGRQKKMFIGSADVRRQRGVESILMKGTTARKWLKDMEKQELDTVKQARMNTLGMEENFLVTLKHHLRLLYILHEQTICLV